MNKCVLMRKDGSYVHVLKNASILKDADGQVMGAVETMMDISELIEKDTQIEAYRRELRAENGFHGILGASVPMQQVFDVITNAAQSDAPVIIYGESGTGKELVAKAIHELGTRKRKPFVKVNCPISAPPLRDRVGDIPLLAESFFRRVQLKSGKKIRGISKEALKILMEYPWPGNVRELKSAFEYAFVSARDAMIRPDHFPPSIFKASNPAQNASHNFGNSEEMRCRELIEALRKSKGNQSEAARILGVSRVTVWKRIKPFGINNKPKYEL